MREGFFCSQCGRFGFRSRNTKDTCSHACRKKKSRGVPYRAYWEIDTTQDRYEDFLQTALKGNDRLFTRLQQIKDRYGRNAMLATIDAIHITYLGGGISE